MTFDLTTHVAAQVVTGIGVLGAGVILRDGINVHGLNTATTLWCSAMVGTLAGAGRARADGGRLSLEPTVSGATWQVDRTIPEP